MKRQLLSFLCVCCALALTAGDGAFKVTFKGNRPTITDLAWAYLSNMIEDEQDEDECTDESYMAMYNALKNYRQGTPQAEDTRLTVDERNGYIVYTWASDGAEFRIEMCYWNEQDRKHLLLAMNVAFYDNGVYSPGQFDGLSFARYDVASRRMRAVVAPGFDPIQGTTMLDTWVPISYSLPRSGKDITRTIWHEGAPTHDTLKWTGHSFTLKP